MQHGEYSILLVDDEKQFTDNLACDAGWDEIGITEVFTAYSGREALKVLGEERIDVVVTDIRMPGIDGLALLSEIHEQWPHARVVVLSGFDEFEYAQRAIEFGVVRYLSKPAAYPDVVAAVRQGLEEREEELRRIGSIEDMREQIARHLPVLRERFLLKLCEGVFGDQQRVEQQAQELGLEYSLPSLLLMLQIDEWSIRKDPSKEDIYVLALHKVLSSVLTPDLTAHFFRGRRGDPFVLVQGGGNAGEMMHRRVVGMIESFQRSARYQPGCIVSVFYDRVVPNLGSVSQSYSRILASQVGHIGSETGIVVSAQPEAGDHGDASGGAFADHAGLTRLITSGADPEHIRRHIHGVFERIKADDHGSEEVMAVYHDICSELLRLSAANSLKLHDLAGDDIRLFSTFDDFRTLEDVEQWAVRVTQKYVSRLSDATGRKNVRIAERAKAHIEQHVRERLSVSAIADCVGVHPNYLSRVFRRCTGTSLGEYVVRTRIERAKQLLRDPAMKIYEVASEVGYESPGHFNRIFKRHVGISPKQFQVSNR
jgi:two-component system response regulator YesN